jgi:DnaK suppressor protein
MSKTITKKKAPAKDKAAVKKGVKIVAPKGKTVSKKAAPKKTVKKKAVAKKVVKKKAPAKKAAPKKKAVAKKVVKKKAAPKKAAPVKAAAPIRKSTFKRQITALLNDFRTQILKEVSEKIRSESDDSKLELGDIYDIASSERERELSLILGDRDRAKLGEIEDALDRLALDCYEECEECGEPIAQKRLLAMPFTRVCVECKSKHERRQKATGRFEEDLPAGLLEKSGVDEDIF